MSFGELFAVGGPIAGLGALLGYLTSAYLAKKRSDRQGVRLERESESGIVETTAEALRIVREQMKVLRRDMADLQAQKDALASKVKAQEVRIEGLEDKVDEQGRKLRRYREQHGELA